MLKKAIFSLIILPFVLSGQISNPDKPARGNWDFQPEKVWEIEDAGNDLFASISGLGSDTSGNVFIMDSKHFKIFGVDRNGKPIASFGKQGEGPGEIKRLGLLITIDNTVILPEQGKVHVFSSLGRYLKSTPIPATINPRLFIDENRLISIPYGRGRSESGITQISLFHLDDQSRRIIAEYRPFKEATQEVRSGGTRRRVSVFIRGWTPMMEVAYGNGRIYYGMSDTYWIKMSDLTGKDLGEFNIKGRKTRPVSRENKRQVVKRLMANIEEDMLNRIIEGLPDHTTHFSRMKAINGLLVVYLNNRDGDRFQIFDIFSSKGEYLFRAQFQAEEGRDLGLISLSGNHMIVSSEDSDGNFLVSKYRILWPAVG